MKHIKQLLSVFMCACICLSMLPSLCLEANASEQWLWPLAGCHVVLSNFGWRDLDGDGTLEDKHQGIDIIKLPQDSTRGMPVRAAKSGTIITSVNTCTHYDYKGNCGCNGGAGNYVVIKHSDGTYSRYLHLLQSGVHGTGYVSQGETIGYVGTSGWSYGYHLHFDMCTNINDRANTLLNPMPTNSEITIMNTYSLPSGWPSEKTTYLLDAVDPSQPPTLAILSTDHTSYEVDETVVFSISANGNVNNLWIYCPNGETLTYTDVGWRYELAFGMSGHFQALVETWNGVGSKCSDRIDFYVGNPTYAYLSTNKTNYAVDERVYFSIDADGIQNNLWIYCPNGDTLTYTDVGTSYDLGFGMSGHFQALVETWNGVGSKCSNRIDFYVGNQTVTVTFDPNGGSVSPTTKTVTIGSTYGSLPTPTRTYNNFDGWYTSATGGSKVTESTTVTATSNHTLYAHWTHVCANGHNYNYTVTTAPTASATGTLSGSCSRCGATTSITLPKLDTTNYTYTVITAASCTANGTGRYTWKTTTYGTFSFDVTIPKTGHSYSDAVTPPTCTDQGYTTHTCSRCGDSYQDSYVDAFGHSFGAWTLNKAPTCTEKGEETRTCSRCSYTETREIAATGHNWNNPLYAWADDNSNVTASRTCKTDFSHIEVETVNATWAVTKEATYDEEGEITYTAVFQNTAFETQTKVVKTPKLEKPDDPKPNPFVDVVEGKYYYNPVLWAFYHDPQITSGTSETTFSPNDTCTRAQIVTFLWRAAGSPEPTTTNNPFDDVKSDKYYFKAVLWAAETGVTSGTSDTTFSPNDGCTRAQVVTFLWRFAGSPEPATATNPFTDVPAGKYYTKAVLWAAEKGVTAGTSETTFSPNQTCTRGQIVTFLYRYMEG